jgi:serine/threonine-protein kinase
MIGKSLLHYEVTGRLGEGGMGEVYRATDTRLGREVAVKVLPPAFVEDEERLARFHREAQLLASLNHPNIGGIFGLEQSDEQHFLVLELIEGETLGERLASGSLPIAETLELSRQIAEALQVAHARGIVHRDLKPANIKITPEGQVKVLDFGLAKAWDQPSDANLSLSPTLTAQMTQAGVILGTASYMSPEQARAQDVDKRADIWSFGIVMFEMLAGGRIFPGQTVTDILGAIVHKEPDWDRLPANLSSGVRRLLRRCLEKDRDQRLQDIGDARIEIEEALAGGGVEEVLAPAPAPRSRQLLPWAVAILAIAVAGWTFMSRGASTSIAGGSEYADQVSVIFPESHRLSYDGHAAAISPDGRTLAYCALAGGDRQLFIRRLESRESSAVEGSRGCRSTFFSPDGEWIGIIGSNEILKVRTSGGTPVRLIELGGFPVGASWADDGSIYFVGTWGSGMTRIPVDGGEREQVSMPDVESGDSAHIFPEALPGSRTVLYTAWSAAEGGQTRILALDVASGESQPLLDDARVPRYSETGHLLFVRGDYLMAIKFDPEEVEVQGTPFILATNVRLYSENYGAVFDVSDEGSLVFQGGGRWVEERALVWVDREGETTRAVDDLRDYSLANISPDGDRLLVTVRGTVFTIWVYDLAAGTRTKLSQEGDNGGAIWMPGGNEILHWSNQVGGRYGVFRMVVGGGAPTQRVAIPEEGDVNTIAVSPDGEHVIYSSRASGRQVVLSLLNLSGAEEPSFFLRDRSNKNEPAFSPDGRWVAFTSDESGLTEVHVAPFPGPGANVMISSGGGRTPRWSADGRELFYHLGPKLFGVQIDTGDQVSVGKTEMLLDFASPILTYDVAPDGRFLFVEPVEQEGPDGHQLNLIQNWPAVLSSSQSR